MIEDKVIGLEAAKARVLERMAREEQERDREALRAKQAEDDAKRAAAARAEEVRKLEAEAAALEARDHAMTEEAVQLLTKLSTLFKDHEAVLCARDETATRLLLAKREDRPARADDFHGAARMRFAKGAVGAIRTAGVNVDGVFTWLSLHNFRWA